jgi:hypothetical protein
MGHGLAAAAAAAALVSTELGTVGRLGLEQRARRNEYSKPPEWQIVNSLSSDELLAAILSCSQLLPRWFQQSSARLVELALNSWRGETNIASRQSGRYVNSNSLSSDELLDGCCCCCCRAGFNWQGSARACSVG